MNAPPGFTWLSSARVVASSAGNVAVLCSEHDRTNTQSNRSGKRAVRTSATAKVIPRRPYSRSAVWMPVSDTSTPVTRIPCAWNR